MYRQQYPDDPGMHNNQGSGYSHTRVSYRRNASFCERIKSSLVSFVAGLVLLAAGASLLFWNEGRAVQRAQSLDEGLSVIIPLSTTDVAFEANNGKLVHLSGPLFTEKAVTDSDYGVTVHVVKLKRIAEMLQWIEEKQVREYNVGSEVKVETSYSYSMEWKEELISSASFDSLIGHENPKTMPVKSNIFIANPVQVGNYHLSENLISSINVFKPLSNELINLPQNSGLKIYMGYVYNSFNPQQPQVGDMRLMWEYAGISGSSMLGIADQVSIIARQSGTYLTKYETEAGDDLEILYPGVLSAKEIFEREHVQNSMMTWAIRFGGWLIMFIGFGCLTSIVTTLVDWIPIVRDLVAMGVGAMNTALSVSLSITIIAIGWIRYRPMLGFTLLGIALLPLIISKLRRPRSTSSGYNRNYYS
ncbi:hypothetical protein SNE40_015241 [Patella caerulea]|uniref:Uncharacterized protein n=2 Tax=Patella caerulea TaxID=87958 RepID=A0AAN8PUW6_PATCE